MTIKRCNVPEQSVGRNIPVTVANIIRLQDVNRCANFKNSNPWYDIRPYHWAYERVNVETKYISSQIYGNPVSQILLFCFVSSLVYFPFL
jgi:hypothetical protein